MSEKQKTGLGTKAFFKGAKTDQPQNSLPEQVKPDRPSKIRTTVMLYTETLAGLNLLRANLTRKRNKNVTLTDVLNEAIQDLMKKEGIDNS